MIEQDIRLFGVVGNPISHSISPTIHNNWIQKHNLKAFYTPILIQNSDDFMQMIPQMPLLGFCGLNITVPFKQDALKICNKLSNEATAIKAVNCIRFEQNGSITGYNTDFFGFFKPLKQLLNNNFSNKNAIVFGAGGASRAVIYALRNNNISTTVYNRTTQKLTELQNDFNIKTISGSIESIHLAPYNIIINATSVGIKSDEVLDINYSTIQKDAICYDLIYKKSGFTKFIEKSKQIGATTIDGSQMLTLQAAKSFEIWNGFLPE